MDNNKEHQEFDLDAILNEFHDLTETDAPEVEPDKELEELLHLPELTITPVVVKAPELPEPAAEPETPAESQTGDAEPNA